MIYFALPILIVVGSISPPIPLPPGDCPLSHPPNVLKCRFLLAQGLRPYYFIIPVRVFGSFKTVDIFCQRGQRLGQNLTRYFYHAIFRETISEKFQHLKKSRTISVDFVTFSMSSFRKNSDLFIFVCKIPANNTQDKFRLIFSVKFNMPSNFPKMLL